MYRGDPLIVCVSSSLCKYLAKPKSVQKIQALLSHKVYYRRSIFTAEQNDSFLSLYTVPPQSHEILQTFVRRGAEWVLPTIQTSHSVKFFCLAELREHLASFTKNHYHTWQFCYCLGPLFSVVTGFSQTGPCQKLRKTVEGSASEV